MSVPTQYRQTMVTVPNGRSIAGYIPGMAGVVLLEHLLRDRLAAQVSGVTEVHLGYGRADVLTAETVYEVKPAGQWRRSVRQALQYSAQTGCVPAIALFGAADRDEVLNLYLRLRDGQPAVQLWWWRDEGWHWISSRAACRVQRAPSDDLQRQLAERLSRDVEAVN